MGQMFSPAASEEVPAASDTKTNLINQPAAERLKEVTRLEVDRLMALWYYLPDDVPSVITTRDLFESVRCGEDDEAVEARIAVAIQNATDNLTKRRTEVDDHRLELDKEDQSILAGKMFVRTTIQAQKIRKEWLLQRKEEKMEAIQDIDRKMIELASKLLALDARHPVVDIERKRLESIRKRQEIERKVLIRLKKALEDRRG